MVDWEEQGRFLVVLGSVLLLAWGLVVWWKNRK